MRDGTRRRLIGLALAAALLAPAAGASAADAVDLLRQGPEVGAVMGELVMAEDQAGHTQDFRSLRGKHGLILLFARSFEW